MGMQQFLPRFFIFPTLVLSLPVNSKAQVADSCYNQSFHCEDQPLYTCNLTLCGNRDTIDVSRHYLTGTIPGTFFLDHQDVTKILLNDNQLSGTLPNSIGSMRGRDLNQLVLAGNLLSGTLPKSFGSMRLSQLALGQNLLSGTLPNNIGSIEDITSLAIGANRFSGTLPAAIGSLHQSLESLALNGLTGQIPHSIGSLTNLVGLYMPNGKFSGTLPHSFAHLSNKLTSLYLNGNQLSGKLPEGMGHMFHEEKDCELDLSNTMLSGHIPDLWCLRAAPKVYCNLSKSPLRLPAVCPEILSWALCERGY